VCDKRWRTALLKCNHSSPRPCEAGELDRLELLLKQIKTVEVARDALPAVEQTAKPATAVMLLDIRGIGPEFAAILWSEGLFRHFENRRQIAAYAGLAPTPWQSGPVDREQECPEPAIRDCEQH
jgi:transposase